MTVRAYIFFLCFGTLSALIGLLFILITIDPFVSHWVWRLLFFVSLSIAVLGSITLAMFSIRKKLRAQEFLVYQMGTSLRQSLWITIFLMGSLVLLHVGLLRWWNALLLAVLLFVIEMLSISMRRKPIQNIKTGVQHHNIY